MFLPVRTPYDRQTLIEHILDRVHIKHRVQVLLDGQRWWIDRLDLKTRRCSDCGHRLETAVYDPQQRDQLRCVACVFGDEVVGPAVQVSRCGA